jgi:hypothetical protein
VPSSIDGTIPSVASRGPAGSWPTWQTADAGNDPNSVSVVCKAPLGTGGADVDVNQSGPAAGAPAGFPYGVTVVTCFARDGAGNVSPVVSFAVVMGILRQNVLLCGTSSRSPTEFIRGDLAQKPVTLVYGQCNPDANTQALLVTRSAPISGNGAAWKQYLEGGGVIITEYNIAHTVYNQIFVASVPQGARNGNCADNVQPAVQLSPANPFWAQNVFTPVPDGRSGCGYAIEYNQMPGFVPIGGWSASQVSIGYINVGAGRLWLVEADWQDHDTGFTDASRDLMAAFIRNSAP